MKVAVDGAELFYTTHGSGPTCLVLSAIGTVPYERQMAPQIMDHLTMVYIDLWTCPRSWTTGLEKIPGRRPQDWHASPEALAILIGTFWPIEPCGRTSL